MKIIGKILIVLMIFFVSCTVIPYNPNKPEMSVLDDGDYKTMPKTFNQFRNDWMY